MEEKYAYTNKNTITYIYTHFTLSDSIAFENSFFGEGTGSILLDDLECTGSESRLVDCYRQSDDNNCGHKEDAGVRCTGEHYN